MKILGIPIWSQNQKEGIQLSAIKAGTKLNVETMNSIYEICVVNNCEITISGGMKKDGSVRFPKPLPGMIIGSTIHGEFKMGWIMHGMRLIVGIVPDGTIETSPVIEVKLEGADWNYSMDWRTEPSMYE